jgi:hypothetical protein
MVSDGSAIIGSPSPQGVKAVSQDVGMRFDPLVYGILLTELVYSQSAHTQESPEASEHDLYVRFKTLQRQLEFVEIQASQCSEYYYVF